MVFGMGIGSALAIFFVIWWLTLFIVLPFGIRSQAESGVIEKGTDPGAPVTSRIGRRLLITTVLAVVFFALFLAVMHSGLTLDMMPGPMPHRTD
jgi:predicted secreted protein